MNKIKVGVVGVGHLGIHHARIYSELPETELVGIVDIDTERAKKVAEPLDVPYYGDFDTFAEKHSLDAVSIVVPTVGHFEIAKNAIKRGLNVLVEKPVTTTVEQAEELLKLSSDRGTVLQVGHIERFNSAVVNAKEFITDPIFIQTKRIGPFTSRISDVGVVLDLMIHDIDIILSMVNAELVSMSAVGRRVRTDHEDIASVQLRFDNGTLAHILVSRVSEKRERIMEVTEAERFVTVNFETQDMTIRHCISGTDGRMTEVSEHPIFPKKEPLKMELQHFIDCIKYGKQPMVGIKDGKRALEVCVEALKQINGM
ncbi:MAG: Gfo/Idh/MocA family oxidoreductase [Synergistes sp.]|nr:Gfo/Idh/MocA family oxidoreductase [Synergistes sp.]